MAGQAKTLGWASEGFLVGRQGFQVRQEKVLLIGLESVYVRVAWRGEGVDSRPSTWRLLDLAFGRGRGGYPTWQQKGASRPDKREFARQAKFGSLLGRTMWRLLV